VTNCTTGHYQHHLHQEHHQHQHHYHYHHHHFYFPNSLLELQEDGEHGLLGNMVNREANVHEAALMAVIESEAAEDDFRTPPRVDPVIIRFSFEC
jgi:hypothetical protein